MYIDALNSEVFARHREAAPTRERLNHVQKVKLWTDAAFWAGLVGLLGAIGAYLVIPTFGVWDAQVIRLCWLAAAICMTVSAGCLSLFHLGPEIKSLKVWVRGEVSFLAKLLEIPAETLCHMSAVKLKPAAHSRLLELARAKIQFGDDMNMVVYNSASTKCRELAREAHLAYLEKLDEDVEVLLYELQKFQLTELKEANIVYVKARTLVRR